MRALRLFQVDAFTSEVFRGNPAAVVPLERWLEETRLQAIAEENNLSETAFFVPEDDGFRLRWFTPTQEVDLCGHATLASAFVLFTELEPERRSVRFWTRSGSLDVSIADGLLTMDFPAMSLEAVPDPPEELLSGLGSKPDEIYTIGQDANFLAVYRSEAEVRALRPDFGLLERLHPRGVIVTAPGDESDCASRYFAPSYGIPEDPVTGSAHCAVVPYWARRLGKDEIHARQVSRRGGELRCRLASDRVRLSGTAVKYLEGSISLPDAG